jgi:hypothetical protein
MISRDIEAPHRRQYFRHEDLFATDLFVTARKRTPADFAFHYTPFVPLFFS